MAEPKYDKNEIKRLRSEGRTYNQIAQELGCTPQYVSIVLESPQQREKRLAYRKAWNKSRRRKK